MLAGYLSLTARVRTCDALVKRGLMVQVHFGHFLLTELKKPWWALRTLPLPISKRFK